MIYLDNAATTAPCGEAIAAAREYCEKFFNPSALYRQGVETAEFIKEARAFITSLIAPAGYDCIFTSGGTEADNTAVFSFGARGNVVTTLGEHSAVYEAVRQIPSRGGEARFAKLNRDGSVDVDDLLALVDDKTSLVSIVHVNNETGAINDIARISALVKKKNPRAVFHSDGVQAFGKIPFTLPATVDLYSVSAHKIGGFKGTGALVKKKDIQVHPLLFGGMQENGQRSGTENVAGIAAFKAAAQVAFSNFGARVEGVKKAKAAFIAHLSDDIRVLSSTNSSPFILSVSLEGGRSEVIQHILEEDGIIVGTGSACSSRSKYSRILKECGYAPSVLEGVIRISFYDGDEQQAEFAALKLSAAAKRLKKFLR